MKNIMSLDEATHIYRNSERPNMRFTSVTTLLEQYHEPFDEDFHAARVAAKRGVTKEVVIAEWREINKIANEYGTGVHQIMERYLLSPNKLYIPRNDFESLLIRRFQDVCYDAKLSLIQSNGIRPEYIMHLDYTGFHLDPEQEAGLAGTSDIVEDVDDDKFNVWDFKTNKKFDFENKYNEWMRYPVNHLNYSKYSIYSLQISIYAYMYEKETGRKFNRGGLFYWDRNTDTWQLIPVIYMKKEAEMLLSHFKTSVFPNMLIR